MSNDNLIQNNESNIITNALSKITIVYGAVFGGIIILIIVIVICIVILLTKRRKK